ncbi:MAG: hypothetical protein M0R48_10145 [Candidatus Omnitrophica bacterium]|nr:hypothetical protein [Candidatus Omnitrophota bacterium]
MNRNRLEVGINEVMNRWCQEAMICAAIAFKKGVKAVLVTYPTGKQMMKFCQPYSCGMYYEVEPEGWEYIVRNNGILKEGEY